MRNSLWVGLLSTWVIGVAGAAFLVGTVAAQTGGLRAIPTQAVAATPPSSPGPVLMPVSPEFPEANAYPNRYDGRGGEPMMGMWERDWAMGSNCCGGAGWNDGWNSWGTGMGMHNWQYGVRPIQPATLPPSTLATVGYRADVQPIFNARCIACHDGTQGFDLTDYESVMGGSNRGPVIIPGDPAGSRLIQYVSRGYMPYGGPPLTQAQIQTLVNWVAAGAPNN